VISAADIDRLLLSFADAHWRKVGRIIGHTYETLEERGSEIFRGIAKLMDARMAVLVRSGKLEAKGNIKRWGYSEVRLAAVHRTGLARRGNAQKKKRVEARSRPRFLTTLA
jgi:hypothetical protein